MKKSLNPLNQWLTNLETKHNKKIDLSLERIDEVYKRLKIEKIAPVIITVAGTNGKGSTVAILSSICQQAGYKVGEFTSPHLMKFNERIKINSQLVTDKQIVDAFELIEQHLEKISLSYFEYALLAAAILFKKNMVDIAILEVGLGGRLDATNVIDADCAIITTISIDHTDWLGNTIEEIAFEKAGIVRKGKPVIYGDDNCPQSIINHAKLLNADLIKNYDLKNLSFETNLIGEYQQKNINTAITALKSLSDLINISSKEIQKGLLSVELSGRLQVIKNNPKIIVDVSHNKQAAKELASWLKAHPINGQTIAVFAVLADKVAIEWLNYFNGVIDNWNISQVTSDRAMPTKEVLKALSNTALLITSHDTVAQAYMAAKQMANAKDRIIVFGSFYTVSEVLAFEQNNHES